MIKCTHEHKKTNTLFEYGEPSIVQLALRPDRASVALLFDPSVWAPSRPHVSLELLLEKGFETKLKL
jgi:hypothetical protein